MATHTEIELSVLGSPRFSTTTSKANSIAPSHDPARTPEYEPTSPVLPRGRSLIVIGQLAGITFMTSFSTGLVTIALPAIAGDLGLKEGLLLWPSSAFSLTCGTCLLLAGTFADVIGPRTVNLVGCLFIALFTLACGLSQTGLQLIIFRAFQGIATALTLPSSFSIVSTSIESGSRRNLGFATLGLSMPLGFSAGLVLGGVLVTGPGWRTGFYIGSATSFLMFLAGIWALPVVARAPSEFSVWTRLAKEVDWIGAGLSSSALALFSYVLGTLSSDVDNIKRAPIISLLIISVILGGLFVAWVQRQENMGRSALVPNSIWKKRAFTTICIMVLVANAVTNCMELFSSLFFQEVQHLSALQASIRILPNMLIGVAINFLTGTFIHKVPAIYAVLISTSLCSIAPLLMALINPTWPYWRDAFFAQLLSPLSADILFTIGILIVSDVFPARTQALAGAVFNTVAQLGTSIGLTTTSVISASITRQSHFKDKSSPGALMDGYRAAFWTMFAWTVAACFAGAFGLRKLGMIGQKRD